MRKEKWNTFTWQSPSEFSLWFDYVNHNPMTWNDLLTVMGKLINR